MDLHFAWVCVSLQDEGSVKSKPNVRSAGHPSVMLIHSFSSLSQQRRSHLNTNAPHFHTWMAVDICECGLSGWEKKWKRSGECVFFVWVRFCRI